MSAYIYILIYNVVLIFGLVYYKKYNHNLLLKFWFYFLIYSFLTECLATYIIYGIGIRATFTYNLWNIINTLLYMFFYGFLIKKHFRKYLIFGLFFLYAIYTLVELIFFKDIKVDLLVYNSIIGMFIISIPIMLYFVEILNSDSILTFQKSIYFWISIGVLIFNIGLIPVYVIAELINWQGVFNHIILGLNLIMAVCFITGFIVSKKEFNS